MAKFGNDEVAGAVAHKIAGDRAKDERDEIDGVTLPGRPPERCNGDPKTCERRVHVETPFCTRCQGKPDGPRFTYGEVPKEALAQWFVQRGAKTRYDRGFASKESANAWIDGFGRRLEWRSGCSFKLRDDTEEMSIVDRQGNRPDAG